MFFSTYFFLILSLFSYQFATAIQIEDKIDFDCRSKNIKQLRKTANDHYKIQEPEMASFQLTEHVSKCKDLMDFSSWAWMASDLALYEYKSGKYEQCREYLSQIQNDTRYNSLSNSLQAAINTNFKSCNTGLIEKKIDEIVYLKESGRTETCKEATLNLIYDITCGQRVTEYPGPKGLENRCFNKSFFSFDDIIFEKLEGLPAKCELKKDNLLEQSDFDKLSPYIKSQDFSGTGRKITKIDLKVMKKFAYSLRPTSKIAQKLHDSSFIEAKKSLTEEIDMLFEGDPARWGAFGEGKFLFIFRASPGRLGSDCLERFSTFCPAFFWIDIENKSYLLLMHSSIWVDGFGSNNLVNLPQSFKYYLHNQFFSHICTHLEPCDTKYEIPKNGLLRKIRLLIQNSTMDIPLG